ncbi:esterase/lipase family protein [Cupriavidus malaysiensis]|uniref:Acetyltransferase n=1 Tax=Cupriavidus malaysiensis TaxID=367825 RepID=A0ABM6F2F5_9BURK|nr:alpha/beta fold hydrolase [Cupriavidus malaysiensis]AOZ05598.1 acetyltransferase [Cupriavidus malaysiensis]
MTLSASALRRLALAGQFGLGLACAAALARWASWRWPAAALGAALLAALVFGLVVAGAFAISLSGAGVPATRRPAVPQAAAIAPLGAAAALACYLYECTAVFRMFNWIEPFRSSLSFVPPHAGAPARPPLLLVHGYACNHAVWLDLQPALAAAGYACEAIDLLPLFDSIDNHAGTVLARMRAIHARTGQAPLLLCHSMGGLAARAALVRGRAEGGAPCAGLVTLGSPHQGCALASLGAGASARQMRCDSAWLRALADAEGPAERALLASVFSWHDSIAGPAGTSCLPGARHWPLAGVGHVALLRHPRARDAVLAALDAFASAAPHAAGATPSARAPRKA